jgi:hypothetical protein
MPKVIVLTPIVVKILASFFFKRDEIVTKSGNRVYKTLESDVSNNYCSAKLTVNPNKLVLAANVYRE